MADDELIGSFCAITSATPEQARQYLQLSDNNLEPAIQLFFDSPDLGNAAPPPAQSSSQPTATRDDPINIDDDIEDDEAMARRLQQEMYGGGGGGAQSNLDQDGVRAPIARTAETLVGPGSGDWRDDPNDMHTAVMEQMMARQRRRAGPGIFNQREPSSIWANEESSNIERHTELSRATGGASEASQKSNHLAQLFRPPFDLISDLRFEDARDEGKEEHKWILVNLQDPSIFDCQVLNRDLWKDTKIVECVKENFIFLQFNKDDPKADRYVGLYFSAMRDNEDMYPHIAIIDPRTGEQVKSWSGSPAPTANEFLMDLYEFLDRYSLDMAQKNPVQTKKKDAKKEVGQMSEEEMLEMALANSMENSNGGSKDQDPDSLTDKGKGRALAAESTEDVDMAGTQPDEAVATTSSPFANISSTTPHQEPPTTEKEATRIQFRYSGGRVVRRFLLSDSVRRIYEWLKAEPLEGTEGKEFELIAMPRTNLIDKLDSTIGEAGLKNASVMVEIINDDTEE
ncbi:hypothetical protein K431DRAFT_280786 [Polychaeton citri CBS 116435]|uniref:UBX domain-containing protein n=1 Tax=Polychaeton citri CBS 116435 TaxID=1314669 RepID=A0A9P4URB2_9PEZI|nr:hypothetical protein K431DRAFT_280786 [Polychaeton citri CBS 116435]